MHVRSGVVPEGRAELPELRIEVVARLLVAMRHEVSLLRMQLPNVELSQVCKRLAARVVQLEEDGAVAVAGLLGMMGGKVVEGRRGRDVRRFKEIAYLLGNDGLAAGVLGQPLGEGWASMTRSRRG